MGSMSKRRREVKVQSICIFRSKANDYHLKIIADKEYTALPSHPRISIKVKKKPNHKTNTSIWVNCNKKKNQMQK